jgi:hypothetical protein
MSAVAFSDAERDMLRTNGQRIQFAKLAEAARDAWIGGQVNYAIQEFVTCMRWLSGGRDIISLVYTWPTAIRVLSGGAVEADEEVDDI